MENIIRKIKKGAKHTRLSAEEKVEMKSVLVRNMKLNPANSSVLLARNIASPFFNINNFRNKKGISILVIGGLLMSGSVSLAAENTVPGDVLFPVKIYVNENIRGAVAVTPKAKAEWEVRLVERRLEEVEKLAVIPDVSSVVQQVAEENLKNYSERVKNRIARFEEDEDGEGAMVTASKLSDVYNTHEQVLVGLDVNAIPVVDVATSSMILEVPVVTKNLSTREQSKNTLKKVQGARDDAEKKHKELMVKYGKEKAPNAEVTVQQVEPQVETKNSKSRNDDKDKKQKEKRTEEIRSTVNKNEVLPLEAVKTQEETMKVETHVPSPKVEDHD